MESIKDRCKFLERNLKIHYHHQMMIWESKCQDYLFAYQDMEEKAKKHIYTSSFSDFYYKKILLEKIVKTKLQTIVYKNKK